MSTTKGYNAKLNVNTELLNGNFIDDLEFVITNTDGTPYDFSGATDFELRIYTNKTNTRKLLDTETEGGGTLSETGGIITWNGDYPSAVGFGEFPYELDFSDVEGPKRVAEGLITVI